MKRLLYTLGPIAVILTLLVINIESIANWWFLRNEKDPMANELPYFKNQYIITFPLDSVKAKLLRDSLAGLGLRLLPNGKCSCTERVQLWGSDEDVAIAPETDPPGGNMFLFLKDRKSPQDTSTQLTAKGFSITRNYKITEWVPKERFRKPVYVAPSIKPIITTNPEIKVAIVDTGVDTTIGGLSSMLFRNTPNSYICNPSVLAEGKIGLNLLNTTNSPTDVEPVDEDGGWTRFFWIFNFYRHGHGTLINSIIGGKATYPNSNSVTIDESANIKLINAKFIQKRAVNTNDTEGGKGSLFKALCGIYYALDKGATVISASWNVVPINTPDVSVRNAFVDVLTEIHNKNAVLVASAGNNGINDPNLRIWPAAFSNDPTLPVLNPHVIAVGASNGDAIADFSNQGDFVDVYAPGEGISLALPQPRPWWWFLQLYQSQNGSSFAVPFVVREVALLKRDNPSITAGAIKNLIRPPANPQGAQPNDPIPPRIFRPHR